MSQQVMKSLFCRIAKVDEEKRTVTGIGASETVDADGEVFDYAGSKPYIEAWSEGAQKRSAGKSFGNIREMHQLSAVGLLSEPIVFDDAEKLVILTAYMSDDAAWTKCLDGTYTGFSICGPVIGDKWSDPSNPGLKRYVCEPIEFSVVDLPCNPGAVFTAVKVGGAVETRQFKTKEAAMAAPKDKKKTKAVDGEELPRSAFAYAPTDNPDDWKLPIEFSSNVESANHIRDALARWDQTEMPDAEEKKLARGRLLAAAKEHGIDVSTTTLKAANANGGKNTAKALYDVADMAMILSSLRWTQDSLVVEREIEGDESPVPDKLKSVISDLGDVLVEMAREETSELVTAMKASGARKMLAKAKTDGLARVTKCISALGEIQKCMDGSCDHEGMVECAQHVKKQHKKASDAMSAWADDPDADGDNDADGGVDDKDSDAAKAAAKAAVKSQTQGASPEIGEEEMDEATKALIAKAASDSAEALAVSKANAEGLTAVASALEKIAGLIAGEPMPAKAAGAGATLIAVSKAEDGGSKAAAAAVESKDPVEIAKAILANPRAVSKAEFQGLAVGR